MAIDLQLDVVVVGCVIGGGHLKVEDAGGKHLAFVAGRIAGRVQLIVDGMADLLQQHGLDGLAGGAPGIVGVEVDDRCIVRAAGSEGAEGPLEFGAGAQLDTHRHCVVAHRGDQLLGGLPPGCGGFLLAAVEQREQLLGGIGFLQVVGDDLFCLLLGRVERRGGVFRSGGKLQQTAVVGGIRLADRIDRISHRRAVEHEALFQRQGAGAPAHEALAGQIGGGAGGVGLRRGLHGNLRRERAGF